MFLVKSIFILLNLTNPVVPDAHKDSLTDVGNCLQQHTIDSVIDFSLQYQFVKYKSAGKTPVGFDCSGFMYYVFGQFQIKMPASSKSVKTIGVEVSLEDSKPGDIIYFTGRNSRTTIPGHVGMIIKKGADGSVFFIHASVQKGITVDELHFDYYKKRYLGVRRVTL